MDLGAFSVSLAVKDLEASRAFYEKFGFKVFMGDASQGWKLARFTDVQQADESTTGPASLMAVDPDGNPILVDQHV